MNVKQHIKGYVWQADSQHYKKWGKTEIISSKVRKDARVSTLSTLIQHNLGILSQSNKTGTRNKRNSNRKGRSQTIPICRWHDLILRRLKKVHQKTIRYQNQLHQSSMKQNQFTKISSLSIHQQWTDWETI
jgi:hypothetical protein